MRVHGTISSSVVLQNIATVLQTRFSPPDFCLYMCKYLEFRVRTGMIMETESIYITDGIENAGLS